MPVQVRATVLTVRRVDAYHALTLVAPAIATGFRPGQFITVAVGGPETSMLGRRAFAIHDVRSDHGGTVEFVFEVVGPGTRWLAGLRARDGSFGTGNGLPSGPTASIASLARIAASHLVPGPRTSNTNSTVPP